MRNMVILMFLTVFQVFADDSYSQETLLSLNLNDVTVEEVLNQIEKQSEFYFLCNKKLVDVDRKIDVQLENQHIDHVLARVFNDTDVEYLVMDRQIVLSPRTYLRAAKKILQVRTVTGTVTDEDGEPLIGVTISVRGTTIGSITDIDGRYQLDVPQDAETLVFSYVGMLTREIAIDDQTEINVTMLPDLIGLDEVVVVGYGTQRKRELTGAVSRLSMTEKENLPNTNIGQALRGSVAGVNVNWDGRPGSSGNILIRGITSLSAGNEPLIIVDGIPLAGSLSDINTNDIQSIDILKDGSSSAVYGAKASNGVILITTKQGIPGKPRISYSNYFGMQNYTKVLKGLDGPDYLQKIIDYRHALGETDVDVINFLLEHEQENYNNGTTIDPVDETLQTGSLQSHNISVSGSNDRTAYYLSGAFLDEKGIVYNDNFRRVSFRTNVDNKITDWLTVGLNSALSSTDRSGVDGILSRALYLSPYSKLYDDDGSPLFLPHGKSEQMAMSPIFNAIRDDDLEKNQYLTGNLHADVRFPFLKGLSYRINYANTFNWYKHFQYTPNYYKEAQTDDGNGFRQHNERHDWILENIVRYNKSFAGIHNIELTLLYSREHYEYTSSELSNSIFFTNALGYNQLELGIAPIISSSAVESNSMSVMGRINYNLKDRYLLSVLTRRDGYSAFGKDNKFGIFPSVSVGWIISEESFMQDIGLINNLEIRYSYGAAGNEAIQPYASLAALGKTEYVFGDGSPAYIGLTATSMANQDLSWETTTGSNIGLDFGILDMRISGALELYSMKTKNLLLSRNIPVATGYPSVYTNLGGTANKGIELTLHTMNVRGNEFSWNSTLLFSANRNEITSIYGEDLDGDGKEDDDLSNNWFIGEPVGAIYDFTTDGIYQADDSIPSPFKPGYYRIVDKNESGGIDPDDRSIIGKTLPDFRLGFENTWTYRNFSLMVFINSSVGGKKSLEGLNPGYYYPDRLNLVDFGPYWTPENPVESRAWIGYPMPYSHGIYRSLSFVRLQDVTLSYRIPRNILQRANLISLEVYISGKNLATFTDWPGWDPEIDAIGTNSQVNMNVFTTAGPPMIRSIVAGLRLSL